MLHRLLCRLVTLGVTHDWEALLPHFWILNSNAFQLEESRIRSAKALERLYLIVAVSLLFATVYGMNIQVQGLRRKVDPHWRRGLSYLKIGLRWQSAVLHKGRDLLNPRSLSRHDPEPCFASKKAQRQYYDAIWFTRIGEIKCAKI